MASSSSSSTVLPRWCKKKEEEEEEAKKNMKLKAETIELLNQFFKTVSVTKASVTADEGKAISSAYVKMSAIRRGLVNRNPPPAAADILECRSKIERQISGICSKLSNLKIKDSYLLHLRHLKASSTTPQTYRQLKRKASMQQPPKTGTRKQTSVKAQQFQQDTSISEENYLENLILEEKDYDETARFIETSLRMRTTKEDREVLRRAYENFIRVYRKQHNVIRSIQLDIETEEIDLHMIGNNRSIIVKELTNVCDKVSNLMIKEAYLHHLDEFKTGTKPKKHTQRFINQEESPDIFFKMKGGSHSGGSKSLNIIKKQSRINEDVDEDDFHDHHKCIEENQERCVPRFGRIGNWDPINGAIGADLLHAPVKRSIKEEYQIYCDVMRGACKPQDTFPKYRVACFELFDDF